MGKSKALAVWLSVLLMAGCRGTSAGDPAAEDALRSLGPGFVSGKVPVDGATLHYVRGGGGPGVILLHGFPEDWSAWRHVMSTLSRRFDVVAVDQRGIGGSVPASSDFDGAAMAHDLHRLAQALGLENPVIVGHDVGALIAYDFALLHPDATRGIIFIESLVPGVDPWDEMKVNPLMWHFGFLQSDPLAEQLLLGREAIFIREFIREGVIDPATVDSADVEQYARAHAGADHLRAAFGFYRTFPKSERFNAQHRGPAGVPLVVVAGEKCFAPLLPKMAEAFRAHGWTNVTTETIPNSSHYVLDEQPDAVARLIERHASAWTRR